VPPPRSCPSVIKSLGLVGLVWMIMVSGFAAESGNPAELGPQLPQTGVNLARDDGGWINVLVAGRSFQLSFFDDQKLPVAVDVHHGLVRYATGTIAKDRTVLARSDDGRTLVSPSNVRGPWVFRVHLALFDEGPDDLVETYAFSYNED
jgi:hypothetical protein